MTGSVWPRWLAAMATLLIATPLMAAEPSPYAGIPGIRFEYYDVEARTAAEIYSSMRERSPIGAEGGLGLGLTTWQMSVTWREATRGSSCRVSEPKTSLSITILLPRLTTRSGLTREGLAFWRATERGLDIHEAGHARIAWDHRNDFNEAAVRATCKSIKRVAEASKNRISAIQEAYDRDTRHGQTQTPPIER